MIKIGRKNFANADDNEKIGYCDKLLEYAKQSRLKRDFEWYMNYMFLEGNHYVYYNTVTNALERPPRKRGEVRAVINKVKEIVRAIQNYSTRFQPRWEILPGDLDEETVKNARRCGKFLDYLYRQLKLEIIVNGIVESGLNTSIAAVELDWDEKAEGGLGQVNVILHDSFDIFIDPRSLLTNGEVKGRFIAKTVNKSLDEVKSDERYIEKNRKQVKEDGDLAMSTMKARLIRKEEGTLDTETIKRVTVKEFLLWEDEKNEKGGNIHLLTYGGGQILRDESLDRTAYPIYFFQIPQDPKKVYHRSWVADIVPLNKILDRSLSQKIMYVNQALVYRIITEKGSGVNEVSNEMGEVIEVNRGSKWEQMQMLSLPQTIDTLDEIINRYIGDMGGSHQAALGGLPQGARSGDMIEALQAADANNLVGIRQSLESFLALLGKEVLNIAAEKYVASRVIKITEPEEEAQGVEREYIQVIGEKAGNKPEKTTLITKDNEIIVKIGSWLGYTQEAQRKTLIELATGGLIPADEVLRQFEFPNIEELSRKAREERLEKHVLQAEIAGRNQGQAGQLPTGQPPTGQPTEEDEMVALADKENTQMMNRDQLPPTEGATINHSQAHADFINSETFRTQADQDIKNIFAQHYQGELQMLGVTS